MKQYRELAELYQELEKTSKRLEKTFLVARFLRSCNLEDLEPVILLLQGRAFPEWDPREIGVASKLVIRTISKISGEKISIIESRWARLGDLGLVAEEYSQRKRQATLFSKELGVRDVLTNLQKIASLEGEGTIDKKLAYLSDLLLNASPLEARYIVRTVLGELRVGIAGGILRDAITWAFSPLPEEIFYKCKHCGAVVPASDKCMSCGNPLIPSKSSRELTINELLDSGPIKEQETFIANNPREIYNKLIEYIEDAYNILNDYGELAIRLYKQGLRGLSKLELIPGRPIRVMLAQKADNATEALETVGTPAAVEYKYDGFRMQIHKKDNKIVIYTRRLEDVTKQFPDVVEGVKKINADSFIIDSECVGVDPSTGRFLPFQNISQRIKRKYNISEMVRKIPVELHIFDIVYYNGETILKKPFKDRRAILEKIIPEQGILRLAVQRIVKNEEEAKDFYEESLRKGNEGIMFKALNAPYKPGSRVGYMMKLKPTAESLDLVIVGAEWGEGKRSRWLSSYYVACLDPVTGNYLSIGKVSTGLKEKREEGLSYDELTEILKPLIIEEKGKMVILRPEIVVEVTYQEIQKSPSYDSGYALRFPRIIKIREDRSPREITTINEIEKYYKEQLSK